jgi:hypothetical protein
MSRGVMLGLYRYMMRKLNKDTVNVVLQYVFGSMRRVKQWTATFASSKDGDREVEEICRGDILSEEDLNVYLRHELW